MSLLNLVLLLVSISASRPERIVMVLGQDDPVVSSRVLRQLPSWSDGISTAIVSVFDGLRARSGIEQDFTTAKCPEVAT